VTSPVRKNIAASVHNRLLKKARKSSRPFNELFQHYAIERFLYRLSKSPCADKFVLKGALMLMVWESPVSRPTMDIDLLGSVENSVDGMVAIVQDICRIDTEPDGIVFDPNSVHGERITEDADYEGVRIRFRGSLAAARITIQLDIGFGDIVIPTPEPTFYPTLLDFPAPQLRAYSRESAIAEKFEAMAKLGIMNSRMKDFWDIWLLSRQYTFDGSLLAEAIVKTFATRHTEIPAEPRAFTPAFAQDEMKVSQWKAFLRKGKMAAGPKDFDDAVQAVSDFLKPVVESIVNNRPAPGTWKKEGKWHRF
jgi:predicted nucleotidyltransferase component of viral defense system